MKRTCQLPSPIYLRCGKIPYSTEAFAKNRDIEKPGINTRLWRHISLPSRTCLQQLRPFAENHEVVLIERQTAHHFTRDLARDAKALEMLDGVRDGGTKPFKLA